MAVNGVSGHVMQVGAYRPDLMKTGQKTEDFDDRLMDNPNAITNAAQPAEGTALKARSEDDEDRRVPREMSKGRFLDIYG